MVERSHLESGDAPPQADSVKVGSLEYHPKAWPLYILSDDQSMGFWVFSCISGVLAMHRGEPRR